MRKGAIGPGVLVACLGVMLACGTGTTGSTPPADGTARTDVPAAGEARRVAVDDIDALLEKDDVVFLDVREPKELEEFGTLEGYIHIPLGELEGRLGELPKDKAILTA
jgi:hypothetical protein